MKKVLLLFMSLGAMITARSQVIFYVENPPSLEGNYALTWAPPSAGWGSPDLLIPANAIVDTLVFVDDGTAADSLGCGTLTNGAQLNGQIAVVYRGDCEFGTKSLNAQNAGAIGVVIINNIPGSPIAMGPGADGANVTIPVVMISDQAGAQLRNQILAGNVVAFIGSKVGYYSDDVGFYPKDVLMPKASSNSSLVSQNATEFNVSLGAWVYNYGSDNQTGITLNATIKLGVSILYNQTSAPISLSSGDSAFVNLPGFSQASYLDGYYDMTYTLTSDSTDEALSDNIVTSDFAISDTLFAAAVLDSVTRHPLAQANYQPSGMTSDFNACLHFRDPNASRLAVDGIYFSANTAAGDSLDGIFLETVIYEWNNSFIDLNDVNLAFDNLLDVTYGSYTFGANQENQRVFAPFDPPFVLEDNQRYLFCVKSSETSVFVGFSTTSDYETAVDSSLQPVSPISNDGTWFALGFGTDVVPALGVRMFDKVLGTEQIVELNKITPYPNPAREVVFIPLKDSCGKIRVDVLDLTGKLVSTTQVNMETPGNISVNIDGLSSGQYIFRMTTEDNAVRNFNVVVNR